MTKSNKVTNGYLTAEVLIGFPTRVANFSELKYGQKQAIWDGVSEALKTRGVELRLWSGAGPRTLELMLVASWCKRWARRRVVGGIDLC